MISLTTLTATSSFDHLVSQNQTVHQPVRHPVTSSHEARPLGHRGPRFTALSWIAGSVVAATLLGGVAAAIAFA
jgi:hypothetical protein